MTTCLACFAQAIRGGQTTGTLKAALATTTSPAAFIALSSVYPCARAAVDAAVYLLGASLFGCRWGASISQRSSSCSCCQRWRSVPSGSSRRRSRSSSSAAIHPMAVREPVVAPRWCLLPDRCAAPVAPAGCMAPAITHVLNGTRAAVLDGAPPSEVLRSIAALSVFGLAGTARQHRGVSARRPAREANRHPEPLLSSGPTAPSGRGRYGDRTPVCEITENGRVFHLSWQDS